MKTTEAQKRASKKYYLKNKDKHREAVYKYRKRHPEKIQKWVKEYLFKNREKIRETRKLYHTKNRDVLNEQRRKRYLKKIGGVYKGTPFKKGIPPTPEVLEERRIRRNLRQQEYRLKNRDKIRAYRKAKYIPSNRFPEGVIKNIHGWYARKKKTEPWAITHKSIKARCIYSKDHPYRKKGIKCSITVIELKTLWFRDEAHKMNKPSIDRLNPDKSYSIDNCRYMEWKDNIINHRPRCKVKV